ncbi:kinesin-like protein KIF20B [Scleropages formosus]|uniref:Kinesin family member 20Bb n=1 Tax=Scleropages formosus TaxID=113540 RepID=A0A8C9RRZ5_SCLFO|nr:kinesin-like protein KIF20B [Scleropages formosus]XP_029104467.1 kinesin-like protein KIF20B [Scleropages formosus]
MMESCFNFRLNSMESVVVEDLKKDLSADFSAVASTVSQDSSLLEKEHLQVYLRIRPFTSAEVEHGESQECIVIEPPDTVLVNAPRTSLSARLSDKSVPQAGQQFQFSQVYGPQTTQEEIFDGTVKCLVKDVLEGGNSVVFTYGITNAGKTFTFLGPDGNGGILPRSLNVIFKSIEDHVYTQMNIKPHRCRDFIKLTKDQQDEEVANKRNIMRLFKESDSQSMTSQLSSCKSTLLEGSTLVNVKRLEEEGFKLDVDCHTKFCVWVSFCEIYNENIHDLLEPLSNGAQKRTTLRLSQDVKGTSFVKDLKWVQVNDAEEAYKVLKLGKRNQSFSSTKLNSLSSRSHCIFSIRIIRIEGEGIPRVNTISELTLCDLAGSERCAKTLNKGDRLKEAGNINTSLLILGKCMSALKHNQRSKLQQHVPFRESKLTHYLQGFFCGRGKACMIVNVNQCASMFDETLNVLKFSALAQKVMVPNSKPLPFIPRKTVRDVSFIINNANQKSLWAKRKSSLMAWEMSLEDVQEDEGDEDIEGEDDSSVEESIMEETIQELDEESFEIDRESYNKLILFTEELKEKLLKEESEKLAMEAHIREEVTKEFMELFSKMESDYSERLLREKEIIEERAEKRMEIWKNLVNGNVDSKEGMDFLDGMIGSVQDDLIKIKEDAEAAQTCLSHLPDPHETITRLEKELSDLSEELCKNQELLALKNNEIEMKCHETQQANASLEEMKRNLESKTQKFQELMEMCQEKDDMISKLQLAMDMQVESATSDRHLVESIKEEILQLKQNCRCLKQDRESTHSEARKRMAGTEDVDGQPPSKKENLKEPPLMTDAERSVLQAECTQKEAELAQVQEQYKILEHQLESLKADFEQDLMLKDKEIVDLKQEQISLEVKVSKLVDDLKEQACAHDAVVSSLDTKCKENSRLVNEKEIILKEKNKWQQDAESMAKKLGGLESELREQIKEREKVSEDLEAAKALLMENNENSREKAKIIESLKRENDNLKKELEESQVLSEQGSCSHFHSTMDALRQECEKMVKECVQKSQRIQDLEQEVGRLQGLVTEEKELSGTLRRELADLKDKTQADLGHLEAERNAAAQLKRSYTHLETEVARLKNRVTDLEQQLEVLQIGASKAAKLEVQLAEKDTQLANLQKSLSEAHQKLEHMESASIQEAKRKEAERRRELLKAAEEAIAEKDAELERKAKELQRLKEEVMNGSDKIKSLSLDLQRKEDDAADLKEKLLDSKKQIQQVQKEIESMREDEKTLQRKLNDLEKMKSQLLIKVSAKEQIIQEMRSKQDSCASLDENLERYQKACSDLQVKERMIENMRLVLMEQEETQEKQDQVLEAKIKEIKSLNDELQKLKGKIPEQNMGECKVPSDLEECCSSQCERRLQEMNEIVERMKLSNEKYQADRKKWLDEKLNLINQAKSAEERRNQEMRKFADDRERYAKMQIEMKNLSLQIGEKDEDLKKWRKERDVLVAALDIKIKNLLSSNAEKDKKIEELSRSCNSLPQEAVKVEEWQHILSEKESEIENLKQQLLSFARKCKSSNGFENRNSLQKQTDEIEWSKTKREVSFKEPLDDRNKMKSAGGSRKTSEEKEPSVLDSSEVSTEDGQATSRFPKPELEIQFTPLQPNKVNIKRQGGDSPVTVKITRAAKKRKSSEMDKDPVESENKKNSKRTANSRMTEDCEKSMPRYSRTAGRLRQEESQSSVKAKKDGTLQKIGDFLQSSPTILGCKAKKIMELVNSKSPEAEGNTADALKSRKSKRKLYKTEISSPLDIPSHPIISLDHEDRESDHLIIKRRLRTRTAKK